MKYFCKDDIDRFHCVQKSCSSCFLKAVINRPQLSDISSHEIHSFPSQKLWKTNIGSRDVFVVVKFGRFFRKCLTLEKFCRNSLATLNLFGTGMNVFHWRSVCEIAINQVDEFQTCALFSQ